MGNNKYLILINSKLKNSDIYKIYLSTITKIKENNSSIILEEDFSTGTIADEDAEWVKKIKDIIETESISMIIMCSIYDIIGKNNFTFSIASEIASRNIEIINFRIAMYLLCLSELKQESTNSVEQETGLSQRNKSFSTVFWLSLFFINKIFTTHKAREKNPMFHIAWIIQISILAENDYHEIISFLVCFAPTIWKANNWMDINFILYYCLNKKLSLLSQDIKNEILDVYTYSIAEYKKSMIVEENYEQSLLDTISEYYKTASYLAEKYRDQFLQQKTTYPSLIQFEVKRIIYKLMQIILDGDYIKFCDKEPYDTTYTRFEFVRHLQELPYKGDVEFVLGTIDCYDTVEGLLHAYESEDKKELVNLIGGTDLHRASTIIKRYNSLINLLKLIAMPNSIEAGNVANDLVIDGIFLPGITEKLVKPTKVTSEKISSISFSFTISKETEFDILKCIAKEGNFNMEPSILYLMYKMANSIPKSQIEVNHIIETSMYKGEIRALLHSIEAELQEDSTVSGDITNNLSGGREKPISEEEQISQQPSRENQFTYHIGQQDHTNKVFKQRDSKPNDFKPNDSIYHFFENAEIYNYHENLDEDRTPGTFFQKTYLHSFIERVAHISSLSEFYGFVYMLYNSDCFNWGKFIEAYIERQKTYIECRRNIDVLIAERTNSLLDTFTQAYKEAWRTAETQRKPYKWRFLWDYAPSMFDDIFNTKITSLAKINYLAPSQSQKQCYEKFYVDPHTNVFKQFISQYNVILDIEHGEKHMERIQTPSKQRTQRKSNYHTKRLNENVTSNNRNEEDDIILKLDSKIRSY